MCYFIWCFSCMFFSKEINRQKNVKPLLLRNNDVLKTFRKKKLLGKKIWRNAPALKSKKVQGIFRDKFFWHYCLQLFFAYKTVSQISFNLFCLGDKRLLSEFLRKWGWFQRHNEPFPKCFGKKLKFQKTETRFCRWNSTDNNDINIFLPLENPCTFLLAKEKTLKRICSTNSELSQRCYKKTNSTFQNNDKLAI